jgi:hypothetical protein
MRKVLLATTALVAMSVTAAQADVSVGGSAVFEIYSPGTGAQTFTSDGSVVIKGSTTTDSGLTFTAVQDTKFEGATTASSVNDAYIEVSGDFGTLRAGQTDGALDRMDGALAANMDLEGTGSGTVAGGATNLSATAIGGDSQNISLHLPSMSGLSLYGETQADGAGSGLGANYSIAGVSLMVQQKTGGTGADSTAMGASFGLGGIKVNVGSTTKDKTAAAAKITANDIGMSYTMGEITLVATSARGKQGTRTDKYSNVGVKYTIAPGVSAMVESGQATINNVDTDATWAALSVAF